MANKIIGLAEAAALVPDGASISFGGFTTQRHPMAFVYELIRLKRRNLYVFGHSPGGDWDILIGAGFAVTHLAAAAVLHILPRLG